MLEILAPAGNLFKLQTAVRYGADAVYIAGQRFGLRSAADNFSDAEIQEGVAFAHQRGAKVFVVLNGFLFDDELSALPAFLKVLEAAKVDAVIVSDMGVVETVRTHSRLAIHLSTQASTLNSEAAKLWKELGVSRIVLGREVSIEEAGRIKAEAGIEVELFGHGAMCMAYSGNCTISNYTAGRDSNRGGCIQSCRFKYQLSEQPNGAGPMDNLLSSKDLRGVTQMKKFLSAGIDSLKIEGRMKSPLYVASTVRAYQSARDAVLGGQFEALLPDFLAELDAMGHREYSEANLLEKAGKESVYYLGADPGGQSESQTHEVLGHVLEVYGQEMAILVKNPMARGDQVELLRPKGLPLPLDLQSLRDVMGAAIQRARPGQVALLQRPEACEPNYLLRKAIHAETLPHTALA